MKKNKAIFILCMVLLVICVFDTSVIAQDEDIMLKTNQEKVKVGEEFTLSIQTQNVEVAACNIKIYFEPDKVELISSPENSNVVDNAIIYSWFDKQGGVNIKKDAIIAQFQFKAKENGITNFDIQGEFYNKQEQKIDKTIAPLEITIGEELDEIDAQILQENSKKEQSNTNLAILRLEQEGINPTFQTDIKEYYLTIGEEIQNLEITAIPENENSKIEIEGNENLQIGMNTIRIKVTSQNKQAQTEYKIFVTKTKNKKEANANLENLAVEHMTLVPEFEEQTTNYNITVENNINKLNILAIPQNENAKVKIEGEKELKVGENVVNVTVTAPNNITFKKYIIQVKRQTKAETEKNNKIQEQEEQSENINNENSIETNVIDNSKEIENKEQETKEKETKNALWIIAIVLIILVASGIAVIIKKRKQR